MSGLCAAVQDSSVLVQRSALDLLMVCFPMQNKQLLYADMVRLVTAALSTILRRDMSLNRSVFISHFINSTYFLVDLVGYCKLPKRYGVLQNVALFGFGRIMDYENIQVLCASLNFSTIMKRGMSVEHNFGTVQAMPGMIICLVI